MIDFWLLFLGFLLGFFGATALGWVVYFAYLRDRVRWR